MKRITLSGAQLADKFAALAPGEFLTYFVGDLARARLTDAVADELAEVALALALPIGMRTWRYDESAHQFRNGTPGQGAANLFQRHVAMFCREYLIQKRHTISTEARP